MILEKHIMETGSEDLATRSDSEPAVDDGDREVSAIPSPDDRVPTISTRLFRTKPFLKLPIERTRKR
jgi:hypothetical protein